MSRTAGARVCNATALRKASRRVTQLYDDALEPCGLRSTQHAILAELMAHDAPISMSELAHAMVLDRTSLAHNLQPLERDGLVALEVSAEDRRRRIVRLTQTGIEKHRDARALWLRAQERFEAIFGAREAAVLRGTLLTIARDERLAELGS